MKALLRSALPRIAVIVVTALVVVVAAVAVPPTLAPTDDNETPDSAIPGSGFGEVENPAYNLSNIVPEEPDASGNVTVEETSDRGVALIDLAHGNRITEEEIQPLTAAIRDAGYRVEFLEFSTQLRTKLARADAFVVIDPAQSYARVEVDAVESFVENGGRLAMFGEPTRAALAGPFGGLTLQTNKLEPLADRFRIDFGSGYLFNMGSNDGIYRNVFARAGGQSGVVSGVDQVAMYTATRVSTQGGQTVLTAADGTRSSRGDAPGTYPVGVRTGSVLAFGDATFLTGGNYQVVDNERLIGNVVSFLVSGDRRRTLLNYPANVAPDPSITYTSADLLGAAQSIGGDLRAGGENPTLSLESGAGSGTDVLVTTFEDLDNGTTRGTGISLTDEEVSVPGFSGPREGVAIVHAPENSEIDVVIAAHGAPNAQAAASALVDRTLSQYAVSNSTLVIRQGDDSGFGGGSGGGF
ncbi:MAG: hypothetical protein ABEH66_08300 [Halobacteriales archaeon]